MSAIPRAKPVVMVYGNCQAEILVQIAAWQLGKLDRWRFVYVRSYDHPELGRDTPSEDDLRNCAAFWCQHDEQAPFAWLDKLPRRARVVRFPGFDFNLLWPFHAADPENRPEPPRFPFGRCAYGDRIAIKVRGMGLRGEEGLAKYDELSAPALANLGRFLQIEKVRIGRREKACDIQVWPVIENLFTRERLFWTVNHPTDFMLHGTLNTLLEKTFNLGLDIPEPTGMEYLEERQVPIHPTVGRLFGLEWWNERMTYLWDGRRLTHDEYIMEYLAGFPEPDASA